MTNRDFISEVRSSHRLLSSDAALNDRSILAEMITTAPALIKRELNRRKLTATSTIYTVIPCLELEEVPLSQCCEYHDDEMIGRSKVRIPRIGESNYAYAISGVFSINGKQKLKEITPTRYINLLKLDNPPKGPFYWILDNYLYVTDSDVCRVKLVAYFEEVVGTDILYPQDCECTKFADINELCKNPLDRDFKFPGYLREELVTIISRRLLQTYFRLPTDIQSDDADGQAVNQIGK